MKALHVVVSELREQLEEATDPKDPTKLPQYTAALRDGIDSIVPLLQEDSTMAALAFHGQIKFVDKRAMTTYADQNGFAKDDWTGVKKSILVRPAAHKAVKLLEEANLQEVLVIAVVANFKLNQRQVENAAQKEEGEYESV